MTEQGTVAASVDVSRRQGPVEDYLSDNEAVHCPEWRLEAQPHNIVNSRANTTSRSVILKLYVNVRA